LPRRFRGQRKGVKVHRAQLDPDERTVRDRVPVTTAVRTIADVARLDPSGARAALDDALDSGLVRRGQLIQAISRYPHAESILRTAEA
jgi:hypothetical protein